MLTITKLRDGGRVIILDTQKDWEDLKLIVWKGTNLEPNLSANAKEMADIITNGAAMQKYED